MIALLVSVLITSCGDPDPGSPNQAETTVDIWNYWGTCGQFHENSNKHLRSSIYVDRYDGSSF